MGIRAWVLTPTEAVIFTTSTTSTVCYDELILCFSIQVGIPLFRGIEFIKGRAYESIHSRRAKSQECLIVIYKDVFKLEA